MTSSKLMLVAVAITLLVAAAHAEDCSCISPSTPSVVNGVCNCCLFGACMPADTIKSGLGEAVTCTTVPNCAVCLTSTALCDSCNTGYTLLSGQCVLSNPGAGTCTASKCMTCASGSTTRCSTCVSGYAPDTNGVCVSVPSCGVMNCAVCGSGSTPFCTTCNSGYTLSNGQCVQCLAQNCRECVAGSSASCKTCNTGYTLTSAATCMAIPCTAPNCATCEPGQSGRCAVCNTGYRVSEATGMCQMVNDGASLPQTVLVAVAVLLASVLTFTA